MSMRVEPPLTADVVATPRRRRVRADAARNHEGIRAAAIKLFRENGLDTSMEDIARAAGVSKGTIYHRFGSRQALIDDVVDDLIGEHLQQMHVVIAAIDDPGARFREFLRQVWWIQYEHPAANDVLVRLLPGSQQLAMACERTSALGHDLLAAAQAAGAVRPDVTPADLDYLIWERGVVLRAGPRPDRLDYERRIELRLNGLLTPDRVADD